MKEIDLRDTGGPTEISRNALNTRTYLTDFVRGKTIIFKSKAPDTSKLDSLKSTIEGNSRFSQLNALI